MNIKQLRDAKAAALKIATDLHAKNTAAGVEMAGEDLAAYNAAMADVKRLNLAISQAEELMEEQRNAPSATSAGHDVQVTRDASERPFANIGEQLKAIKDVSVSRGRNVDERLLASQGQNETNPEDGGYALQTEFSTSIFRRSFEDSDIASRCFTINMSTPRFVLPALKDDSRADGQRNGGIKAYWMAEGSPYGKAKTKLREMQWTPHKLGVIVPFTEEQLQDGAALQSIVDQLVPEEFDYALVDSILNGDGQGKPLGISASSAEVVVAKDAGQAAGTLTTSNVNNIWKRMPARSRKNAVWVVNQDVESLMEPLLVAGDSATIDSLMYKPAGTLGNNNDYGLLKGRPVLVAEQAAALGTQGDIGLYDFTQYGLARRGGVRADSSIHVYFDTGEMAFRWMVRVDGQPMWEKPVTQKNSANTLSPFAVLAARP